MQTLTDKFSRLSALRPARPAAWRPATTTRRAPEAEDALSQLLGATIATNVYGDHVSVSNWFSTPEFAQPSAATLELLCRTRDLAASKRVPAALSDPTKWLFLDTETTGLSGGTGTYAFLIGLAWWDAGGLQVEQFFMRDFDEEHSILHELAARLVERPVLVTFNGKSFDWPLLENRFTMTRAIATPKLVTHLDLLHPARALWRLRLGSVRLVDLERDVLNAHRLGWHRGDDILSSLIPQHYFDYIRGGPAEPLAAVVRHNQMDLRGLAAILGRIEALLAAPNEPDADFVGLDLFSLSKYLKRRGDPRRAETACSQALDLGLPAEYRPQARREMALFAKRSGDYDRAIELWLELTRPRTVTPAALADALLACEELAIHYERHAKDLTRALEYGQAALGNLFRLEAMSRGVDSPARMARIQKRLLNRVARLQHRMELGDAVRRRALPLLDPPPTVVNAKARGVSKLRKFRF